MIGLDLNHFVLNVQAVVTAREVAAAGSESSRGQDETVRGQETVTAQVRAASVRARPRVQATDLDATRRGGDERLYGE